MAQSAPFDAQAFLKELKTNRRTQGALLGFIPVPIWVIWSLAFDAPKSTSRRPVSTPRVPLDP